MHRRCALAALFAVSAALTGCGVQHPSVTAAGRLVVVYRSGVVPSDAATLLAGERSHANLRRLGMSIVSVAPGEEAAAMHRLAGRADVEAVLQDRFVGLGHVDYVQAKGTSASAPLVAGAAALLHAARPDWTAAQIVDALRSSATLMPEMEEPELNLPAALALP